jgi:uncharacterized protein (DUF924 family)
MEAGMSASRSNDQAEAVLDFWIGTGVDSPAGLKSASERWFSNDPSFDAVIADRFGGDVRRARTGELDAWATTPRGWLALLIVLDQFPRNIFRGTPQAFRADAKACSLALAGIDRGDDQRLSPVERVFAYLPLEHAENLALQDRSVQLFETLRDHATQAVADTFALFHDYAIRHRAVIARFGRFPHRNDILGRISSEAELAYLSEPGSGF